jgi:hypothetical protein
MQLLRNTPSRSSVLFIIIVGAIVLDHRIRIIFSVKCDINATDIYKISDHYEVSNQRSRGFCVDFKTEGKLLMSMKYSAA